MNAKSLTLALAPVVLIVAGSLMAHKGMDNQKQAAERTDLNSTTMNVLGPGQILLGAVLAIGGAGWLVKKHVSGTPTVTIPAGMAGADPSVTTFDQIDKETDAYVAALIAKAQDFGAKRKAANNAARQALKDASTPAKVVGP